MNGHVHDYTTLPGSNRINGGVHGGYGHSGPMLPQGCHHLHHKLPNGLALLNGSSSLFSSGHPHGHDGTLPHSTRDCEHSHSHPHHHHNVSAAHSTPNIETGHLINIHDIQVSNEVWHFTSAGANTVWFG